MKMNTYTRFYTSFTFEKKNVLYNKMSIKRFA